MRILIVDDDLELVNSLIFFLKKEGFNVDQALNFENGLFLATSKNYDAIVLDVNLPDGSGLNLCQLLRDHQVASPILVLSIHSELNFKVKGLKLGADDYLTKPFATAELAARLKSLIRRYSVQPHQTYNLAKVKLDPVNFQALIDQKQINLTKMEFEIISLLFRFRDRVVKREEICDLIYGDEHPLNNAIDVIVSRLRKKLEPTGGLEIKGMRGVGYMIEEKQG